MTHRLSRRPSARAVSCRLVVLCSLLVPALVSTRADPTLSARWHESGVTIDGSIAEWPPLERLGAGPGVAVENDGDALYLAVASKDATVRQQLATGLIVWLDGSARRAQAFGVRLEGPVLRPLRGATPDATATDLSSQALNTLEQFDLLGPAGNQRRLIDRPAEVGIALATGVEDGTVVYELKIPLARSPATPHAVGVKAGATIALGFETPKDPRPPRDPNRLADPTNTNPWVIDPYGGYFRQQPPSAGSSESSKDVVLKPMKLIWALVRLAAAPGRGGAR